MVAGHSKLRWGCTQRLYLDEPGLQTAVAAEDAGVVHRANILVIFVYLARACLSPASTLTGSSIDAVLRQYVNIREPLSPSGPFSLPIYRQWMQAGAASVA